MFSSLTSFLGFFAGCALTVGLLLTPHLIPGGLGYGLGFSLSPLQLAALAIGGASVLAGTLMVAGRMIRGATSWKEARVIGAAVLIAFIANALFVMLVDFFALKSGLRALVAVVGVPVIYGNLSAVLGKKPLWQAMGDIFSGALATIGAGFIVAALIRGW
jgi:hypothetical protein